MFVIFVTALAVLLFRPNVFLFIISILSFYGAFSGVRSLRRKRPEQGERAARLDWGAAFMVQNVAPLLPEALEWTVWVAPGVLGGVGISFWIRHYRKKFATRREGSLADAGP